MKIRDKLDRVHAAVVLDQLKGGQFPTLLKRAAIDAMRMGIGSKEWNEYMALFADNQDQLTRLTVEEPNEDEWLKESRAYIVSNAVCGGATTGRTGLNVDARIEVANDQMGAKAVDAPFPIPDIPGL